jgi:hypothetical protein
MFSLRNESISVTVAQRVSELSITWARGLIGAISAVLLYFILQTPYLATGQNTAAAMIVVGFAAGYSERMVTKAIEAVSSANTASPAEAT